MTMNVFLVIIFLLSVLMNDLSSIKVEIKVHLSKSSEGIIWISDIIAWLWWSARLSLSNFKTCILCGSHSILLEYILGFDKPISMSSNAYTSYPECWTLSSFLHFSNNFLLYLFLFFLNFFHLLRLLLLHNLHRSFKPICYNFVTYTTSVFL